MNNEIFVLMFFNGDITFDSKEEADTIASRTVEALNKRGYQLVDDGLIVREKTDFDFSAYDVDVDGTCMHKLTDEELDDLSSLIMLDLSTSNTEEE